MIRTLAVTTLSTLGLLLMACDRATTAPNPADAAQLVAAFDGADVLRFPFNGASTGSYDTERGLWAVHYVNTPFSQAAWGAVGVECPLLPSPETIDLQVINTPAGRVQTMGSGEVQVMVFQFTGANSLPFTPPITCDDLVAEGRVDLHAGFSNFPTIPGTGIGPGRTHINFKSHGTVNNVRDGGTLRLNWTFQFSVPPSGKDKTNIMLH